MDVVEREHKLFRNRKPLVSENWDWTLNNIEQFTSLELIWGLGYLYCHYPWPGWYSTAQTSNSASYCFGLKTTIQYRQVQTLNTKGFHDLLCTEHCHLNVILRFKWHHIVLHPLCISWIGMAESMIACKLMQSGAHEQDQYGQSLYYTFAVYIRNDYHQTHLPQTLNRVSQVSQLDKESSRILLSCMVPAFRNRKMTGRVQMAHKIGQKAETLPLMTPKVISFAHIRAKPR